MQDTKAETGWVFRQKDYILNSETGIDVHRHEQHPELAEHGHDFFEIAIVQDGAAVHFSRRDEYPIERGDAFVISPGQVHGFASTEDLTMVNVLLQPNRIRGFAEMLSAERGFRVLFGDGSGTGGSESLRRVRLTPRILRSIEEALPEFMTDCRGAGPQARFSALARSMVLVGDLTRCAIENKTLTVPTVHREALKRAVAFMEERLEAGVSLEELAHKTKVSRRTLNRLFHDETGLSPLEYFIRLRLQRAAELLAVSFLPVTEVAFICGFNDSNYFSRQFRKVLGVSPRAYRNALTQ